MRRRFAVNEAGELLDRDGYVLGRVVAITLDMPTGTGGYRGVVVPDEDNGSDSGKEETPRRDGGAGEGKDDPVAVVWLHYVEVIEPRRKELDPESRRLIRDALKVATVQECCGAIDGNKASAFHQGQNDRRQKYNRLSHILKGKRGTRTTREQIDLFLDIAAKAGLQSGVTSAGPARLRAAKREVLDAFEFPGDETVVRQGEEAAAWLAQQGIEVDRGDGSQPPRFVVRP